MYSEKQKPATVQTKTGSQSCNSRQSVSDDSSKRTMTGKRADAPDNLPCQFCVRPLRMWLFGTSRILLFTVPF